MNLFFVPVSGVETVFMLMMDTLASVGELSTG
jgi:hypothetical protein